MYSFPAPISFFHFSPLSSDLGLFFFLYNYALVLLFRGIALGVARMEKRSRGNQLEFMTSKENTRDVFA